MNGDKRLGMIIIFQKILFRKCAPKREDDKGHASSEELFSWKVFKG
jgi:hypothetical protein